MTATSDAVIIRPQAGPQEKFLSTPADIAIYGGQAGGGKTWSLVAEPLRHINNPGFRTVIFRRTFPQITNEGGLYDETRELYPYFGGVDTQPSSGITWTFPSGARIRLTHMQLEKDKYAWQGAQVPLLDFDELTHFTSGQFWYMFSRNRSTCGVRPYIRGTTNPEPGWVAELLDWWIGEDGYAIEERSGVLRWFVRVDGLLVWADTPGELKAQYPDEQPKSLTFIPAKLSDNKILMAKDPGYLASLQALPYVDRQRLLGGNWKVQVGGGKVFNRDWFSAVHPEDAPKGGRFCRYWDLAATAKKAAGDDPDYSAGVLIYHVGDTYYVFDCIAVQENAAVVDRLMRSTGNRDRELAKRMNGTYAVRWEIEPGASGVRENRRLVGLMDGFDCGGERPRGDKVTRAKGLAAQSEQGYVVLVKGSWNERWLTHMHNQPDWPHDDIMDASSGAYRELESGGKKQARSRQG